MFRQPKRPVLLILACLCPGCGRPTIKDATADFDIFLEGAREKLRADTELPKRYSVFLFDEKTYEIQTTETAGTPYTATMKAGVLLPDGTIGFAEFEYSFENRKWVLTNSRNPSMPPEDWERLRKHFTPPP